MNLGSAIKQLRTELNLSQGELSSKIGISQTSLSQIELGYKEPSKRTLNRICETFEIPIGLLYLLGMESQDVPDKKIPLYEALFPSIRQLTLNILKEE